MDSAAWGEKVAKHSRVFKPAGPGPFPVALILHGCGGKTPFLEDYARVAVQSGWAAVVVDSLKPRGMSTLDAKLFVCTGVALHGLKRAADIFAMLSWLETQGWADPGRVFLAGWSHGGWTIMDSYAVGKSAARGTTLVDADPVKLRERVKGTLLVYPYAGYGSLTASRGWGEGAPPVWSVLAGKDQVVGWKSPAKALARLAADGLSVDRVFHADATHAFDEPGLTHPKIRFDPEATTEAIRRFVGFLKARP